MFAPQLIDELMGALGSSRSPSWDQAHCRDDTGSVGDLFFSDQVADINRAKAICANCPLAAQCLDGAVQRREPWGVWGGHLFANGTILAQKRKRGRPRKRPVEDTVQLSA